MSAVLDCALTRWQPGIGDPTVLGWVSVLVYAATALMALAVAGRGVFPQASARRERLFWGGLAVAMLFLAVNKQLDLQSFLTAVGRCMARSEGWYRGRRLVQALFIVGLIAAMLLVGVGMVRLMRGTLGRNGLALIGLVFVLTFVLVRAVSFHHMDVLLDYRVLSVRMNAVLELSGLILILICGAYRLGPGAKPVTAQSP